jgi:hypothetical protein
MATSAAAAPSPAGTTDRKVIQIPLDEGLLCLRGLSPKRLRFEVEYGLERGTSANSFLFPAVPLLVHPPGASFAEPYLEQLAALIPADAALQVVVGHVNPNRVALLPRRPSDPAPAADRCGEAGGQPAPGRRPWVAADPSAHAPLARRSDGL